MFPTLPDLYTGLCLALLLGTYIGVFLYKTPFWLALGASGGCFGLAVWVERLALHKPALWTMLVAGGLFYAYHNLKLSEHTKRAVGVLAFVLAFLLMRHLIPGASNWLALSNIKLSETSALYNLWVNIDKPLLGLLILLSLPSGLYSGRLSQKDLMTTMGISAIAAGSLLWLSTYLGYIFWDPKFAFLFFIWLPINLFCTIVPEEIFFRGFTQPALISFFQKSLPYPKLAPAFGIATAALLFGLLHYWGGLYYILISALAGVFYGLVVHLSGRLAAGILVHTIVNVTHFFLFSYPFAKGLT